MLRGWTTLPSLGEQPHACNPTSRGWRLSCTWRFAGNAPANHLLGACVRARRDGAGDTTRTQPGMNPRRGNARAGSALLQLSLHCGFKQGAGSKGLSECLNAPSPKISWHRADQSLLCLGQEGRCAPDRCLFNTGGFGREEGSAFLPKHLPVGNGKAECAQFQQGSLFRSFFCYFPLPLKYSP